MLRLSKQSDYGLLAAVYLARKQGSVSAARDIAAFYALPLPMISKVLKVLHEGDIIRSHRGVSGGYSFDHAPETITMGRLLEVLEGPWDLVECESLDPAGHALCRISPKCPSRNFMSGINRTVKQAFDQITLGDLMRGETPSPVTFSKSSTATTKEELQ